MPETPATPDNSVTPDEQKAKPRVHASAGGLACRSFKPGHGTHWGPVLSTYPNAPRSPIQIRHIIGKEFEVRFNGTVRRWFFHDPAKLVGLIERDPDNFTVVGYYYINYNWASRVTGGVSWFHMSQNPIDECRSN